MSRQWCLRNVHTHIRFIYCEYNQLDVTAKEDQTQVGKIAERERHHSAATCVLLHSVYFPKFLAGLTLWESSPCSIFDWTSLKLAPLVTIMFTSTDASSRRCQVFLQKEEVGHMWRATNDKWKFKFKSNWPNIMREMITFLSI